METANALSALPKRRALIVPLMVGAAKHDATLVAAIAKFLPLDREAAVMDLFLNGTKLARDALDDLVKVLVVYFGRHDLGLAMPVGETQARSLNV